MLPSSLQQSAILAVGYFAHYCLLLAQHLQAKLKSRHTALVSTIGIRFSDVACHTVPCCCPCCCAPHILSELVSAQVGVKVKHSILHGF